MPVVFGYSVDRPDLDKLASVLDADRGVVLGSTDFVTGVVCILEGTRGVQDASRIVIGVESSVHQRGRILTQTRREGAMTSLEAVILPNERVICNKVHIVVALNVASDNVGLEGGQTVLLRHWVSRDVLNLHLKWIGTLSNNSVA